ncbi:zinc-dependent alcohol dehydrogenase [Leucobacter sp. UCD-THU]|uniref:zinc-dependent alcohol dehydrogenase n=1 Tax=Leucobacter sp. UCD-THU TaxID=1292023 RepID=UPI0009D99FA2|nr:alcohol dehydrogenase catalytic domain-containing protein [Leucobacter sp. UCD-THU]
MNPIIGQTGTSTLPSTMRAAVWYGPGDVRVADAPTPIRETGETLIQVERVGLCGTDIGIVGGTHPRAQAPLIFGHEIVGRVAESDDPRLPVGTRVVPEPLISCGRCRACRTGDAHVCRQLTMYGIDQPGGLARYASFPSELLHVVPAHLAPEIAVLAEPLAVALHSVADIDERSGVVAVVGGGPIGLLTAIAARARGLGEVIIAEPNESRRQTAQSLGFTSVESTDDLHSLLLDRTGGEGADVTFDCAGHPSVALELSALTRVRGVIVLVAVYKKPAALDLRAINFAEQRLLGTRVYRSADIDEAIDLLASASVDWTNFGVVEFALADVENAINAASTGSVGTKIIVDCGGNDD